MTIHHFI